MPANISDKLIQPRLKLTEIFYSIQGESKTIGIPTIFIRLTGCPLRCQYCDTEYAFKGGDWWSFETIINEIKKYPSRYITVTGGEPLAQQQCFDFLSQLCDRNYTVSLETSGAIDIALVDSRVIKVLDVKTPASMESDKNLYHNFCYLSSEDQLKFVICDHNDYEWSKKIIEEYDLINKCEILFSTSHLQLEARELAEWVLADGLSVRIQIQLHKYLWGDEHGR